MKTSVCIIGQGRVGSVLIREIQSSQGYTLAGAAGRDDVSAQRFPRADMYIIATPDDTIRNVTAVLAASGKVSRNTVVMHCSGALASDVLNEAGAGCAASFHPIRSFDKGSTDLQGCSIGIEGDDRAVQAAFILASSLGARPVRISSEAKALYHAATVFASNFVVALMSAAVSQLRQSGFSEDDARMLSIDLARSALTNIEKHGLSRGLTGPVARGDEATIVHHREALKADDPRRRIYDLLTEELRSLLKGGFVAGEQ